MFLQSFRNLLKYKNQVLATITVNLIGLSHGVGLGWISPVLLLLQSDESPLENGKITLDEASWIGAVISLGGLVGNFGFGVLIDKIGRKNALRCVALPHFCFWIIVILSNQPYHWYIARIVAGCGGGGLYLSIPIFVAEISDKRIRGRLGSMLVICVNAGILFGYVIGAYINYAMVPRIFIVAPILYVALVSFLPETPQYHLQNRRLKEAEQAFNFYYAPEGDGPKKDLEIQDAFKELKKAFSKDSNVTSEEKLTFRDFCGPNARKGLIIGAVLMFVNQFSGWFAIVVYASSIFEEAGSNLHPNESAIIVGFLQLSGSVISIFLVDQCGRKILWIVSTFGCSLGLTCMGLYAFFGSDYKWIPVASLSFVIFITSLGILSLPFVILAEVLPQKIRSSASTGCLMLASILSFSFLKLYSVFMQTIQLYGTMWFCASTCIFGGVFAILYLPETKGKPLPLNDVADKKPNVESGQ